MKIAYLCNQYPAPTHPFMRREIEGLEERGHVLLRIAHRPCSEPLPDEADRVEQDRTRYLQAGGAAALLLELVALPRCGPRACWRAVRMAVAAAWRSQRPLAHAAYLAQAARLQRWLRSVGAQHLHAHLGGNPAMVAALCRALGGPPFSFVVHGPEEFENPAAHSLPKKVAVADFVVTISESGLHRLRTLAGEAERSRIHLIHNGLRPDDLAPAPPVPDVQRVSCIARLEPRKGHDVLFEAIRILRSQGASILVTLVGDGSLQGALRALATRLDIDSQLRFAGWQDRHGVRSAIDEARVLVLPTRAEGLPTSIVEAFARQRPVIASAVDGIPELVIPGVTGWLVPPDDPAALAEALRDALQRPVDELRQMGSRAREAVLQRHDGGRQVAQLEALIARAAGARGAAGTEPREHPADSTVGAAAGAGRR